LETKAENIRIAETKRRRKEVKKREKRENKRMNE